MLIFLGGKGHSQIRQRHIIYILDCTASMNGFNGAEDVWESTKSFIFRTINDEDPNSLITVLPFQDNVMEEITCLKKVFDQAKTENILNNYVKKITETNIVKAWSTATSPNLVDPTMENIIILLTDGGDNAKGNTPEQLNQVFRDFCDNVNNSHGYYVQLTEKASIPTTLREIIENCKTMKIIPPGANLEDFNEIIRYSPQEIITRCLPDTITINFSNGKKIKTWIQNAPNKFVSIKALSDYQEKGHLKLVISPNLTYGNNIDHLNKAIEKSGQYQVCVTLESEVEIINPEIVLGLRTAPARSVEITATPTLSSAKSHTKSFLWINETPIDTLIYDLGVKFNDVAISDRSLIHLQLSGLDSLDKLKTFVDDKEITNGEFWLTAGESKGIIKILVPAGTADTTITMAVRYIDSEDLDLINNNKPYFFEKIELICEYTTKDHWLRIIFIWAGISLLSLLLCWFLLLRRRFYPVITRGFLNTQFPMIERIKLNGVRKVVFSSTSKHQSCIAKVLTGKVINKTIPDLQGEFTICPSGKNLRYRCSNSQIVCTPSPIIQKGQTYKILSADNTQSKIMEFQYI